jgi:chromosome segregation ATPase
MSVWALDRQAITTGLLARKDGELKGIEAIRQELAAQCRELEAQLAVLTAERDGLRRERHEQGEAHQELMARVEELERQRNALVAERDDHKAGRLELTARCGELEAQDLRLGGEVARLEGEKETLQAQLDQLLEEGKAWQRKQAELIRCAELSESQLATIKELFVQIQRGSPADPVERAKRKQRKAGTDRE